jgi:hypothetical protein
MGAVVVLIAQFFHLELLVGVTVGGGAGDGIVEDGP